MNKQILRILTVILLVIVLTMTNFIFVGSSIVSYAVDNLETNQTNVKFSSYFKDENGNKITAKESTYNQTEDYLYLQIEVKKEGYLLGNVTLEEGANFKLVSTDNNEYVEKVEENTVSLHNITAGASIEIPIKIEPIEEENFNPELLDQESKIMLNGTYRDSSEKDKSVKSEKTVSLKYVDAIAQEDIVNEVKAITNKIVKIDGEEKRVVQLAWNIGLKEKTYPIKEIVAKIETINIGEATPQVENQVNLNTMTSYEVKNENNVNEVILKNEQTEDGTITWKKTGTENIILTYIYDKDTDMKDLELNPEIEMTLYNKKEITATQKITISKEEQDSVIQIVTKNQENEIYKGKLIAGIERQYITRTSIKVNLAKAVETVKLQENASTYTVNETENTANIFYDRTMIKKEQFDKMLGKEGKITVTTLKGEIIGTIDATTQENAEGYLAVDYGDKEIKAIKIQTTAPIAEGTLDINHIKTAKETQEKIVRQASSINNTIYYQYNKSKIGEIQNIINLKDSVTQSKLTIDKNQLSTVIENNVEMRITLHTNNEKYDLYKEPKFVLELPEKVENIEIISINKMYDDNQEFGEPTYEVSGRVIKIGLNGKQTNYTLSTLEGITLVVNAKIIVNKTAATSDEQIRMVYQNENAVSYENSENVGKASTEVKITAPKEITTVNSIKELNVETIGETEQETVTMEKGANEKELETQIEIINSNTANLNQVAILGEFPTNNNENNMGITVTSEVTVTGTENTKIYYTENEEATKDLENNKNGWTEQMQNGAKVKKYLITSDEINAQSSMQAQYKITVPENLEYNLNAAQSYSVSAVNSKTNVETTLNSTEIAMETGEGPKLDIGVVSLVGENELEPNETVKTGEVIKYRIQLINSGSEKVENIKVIGAIPNGTTLVELMNNYEYTGAAYYEEAEDTSYEKTIEKLDVGEITRIEYEVRVNSDAEAGAILTNNTEVQYGEVKTQSKISNIVENANLRVSIKRVTGRNQKLYQGTEISYYVIVENIKNEKQENVKVINNFSDNIRVDQADLITGMGIWEENDGETEETEIIKPSENTTISEIEYGEEINIGNLDKDEIKILRYTTTVIDAQNDKMQFSAQVVDSNNIRSRSNLWQEVIEKFEIELKMTTSTASQYVKAGDTIEYTIEVINKGRSECPSISINDIVPTHLTIEEVIAENNKIETDFPDNHVIATVSVKEGESTYIHIKTTVEESLGRTEPEIITNVATTEIYGETIKSNEITHIIAVTTLIPEDEEPDDNTVANGSKMITGVAWLDENSDGKRDDNEKKLANIRVRLLNTQSNTFVQEQSGKILETTTNEQGIYLLNNIAKGKYIVIFYYDQTQYMLTKYKASGVQEGANSNAILNELLINGENQKVASTDIIEVNDNNISDINIGLVKMQNFDLQLDKYINKILIQDSKGTIVKQYENTTMAKAELDGKKINGTTVIIEYAIKVTNNGEIDGYARRIADYMPSDLKFNSELNKEWHQQGNTLYNASLANDKISAGESKTVYLTLTKTMTEDNTGRIMNSAEIAEDYNDLGIKDSNSTPGNKAQGENDIAYADVILSIKTGGVVYITIAIIFVIILVIVSIIIIRKKNKHEI